MWGNAPVKVDLGENPIGGGGNLRILFDPRPRLLQDQTTMAGGHSEHRVHIPITCPLNVLERFTRLPQADLFQR